MSKTIPGTAVRSDNCGWQIISEELRLQDFSQIRLRDKYDRHTRPREEALSEGDFYRGTLSCTTNSTWHCLLQRVTLVWSWMWDTTAEITIYLYDPGIITWSSRNWHRCMFSYPKHGWVLSTCRQPCGALVDRYNSRSTAVVRTMPYRYIIPSWRVQVGVMKVLIQRK